MMNSLDICRMSVFVLLLLSLSGCAGGRIVTQEFPEGDFYSPAELHTLPERTHPNTIVIVLEKGETVPLFLNLESDIAFFVQDHVDLQLKEQLYFRLQGPDDMTEGDWRLLESFEENDFTHIDKETMEKFLEHYTLFVSRDAVHWASITDGEACKKVLGIAGGELSVSLSGGAKSGVRASMTLKTHAAEKE